MLLPKLKRRTVEKKGRGCRETFMKYKIIMFSINVYPREAQQSIGIRALLDIYVFTFLIHTQNMHELDSRRRNNRKSIDSMY